MQNNGTWRTHDRRAIAVGVLFCVILLLYVFRLFSLSVVTRDEYLLGNEDEQTVSYPVVMQARRGAIYDRNGVPLVTNAYSHNLVLYYSQVRSDYAHASDTLCRTVADLQKLGLTQNLTYSHFPLEGMYPDFTFSAEATDGESTTYYRLQRVIAADDLNKKGECTEEKLVGFFMKRYGISEKSFTDEEITLLLHLYYDMEAVQFSDVQPYVLAEDIGQEGLAYFAEKGYWGLNFAQTEERIYHYPGYASHILGQVGRIYAEDWDEYKDKGYKMSDRVGISGVEKAFEEYLHGTDGVETVVEDTEGHVLSRTVTQEPKAGHDVYLTIDISLQIAAEDGLVRNLTYVHRLTGTEDCDAASLVAQDPSTGEVLVMASYPTFRLDTYSEDFDALLASAASPLTNRATAGLYAPGSTFKLGMVAVALTEKATTRMWADTLVDCTGVYTRYADYQPKCWVHESESSEIAEHGPINAVEALRVSCNIYFYEAGYRLGIGLMNDYYKAFGFGQGTGVEIGEKTGTLAGPDCMTSLGTRITEWYPGDTLAAAIGQSYNEVTPLQLCAYTGTLMQKGDRYGASLLCAVKRYASDDPVYVPERQVLSRVLLSDDSLQAVRQGMEKVTQTNSVVSYFMGDLPVSVGSKTGTAQKTGQPDYGVFVCAAPLDKPQIVVSVVLEKGSSGSYASYAASLVLGEFFTPGETPPDGLVNENAITAQILPGSAAGEGSEGT